MNTQNEKRTQANAPQDTQGQGKNAPGAQQQQPNAQQQTQRPGDAQQKQAPNPQEQRKA